MAFVYLYQNMLVPKKPATAPLILDKPMLVPAGPIAATSTVFTSTISRIKRMPAIPEVINFLFIIFLLLGRVPLWFLNIFPLIIIYYWMGTVYE